MSESKEKQFGDTAKFHSKKAPQNVPQNVPQKAPQNHNCLPQMPQMPQSFVTQQIKCGEGFQGYCHKITKYYIFIIIYYIGI